MIRVSEINPLFFELKIMRPKQRGYLKKQKRERERKPFGESGPHYAGSRVVMTSVTFLLNPQKEGETKR